MAERKLKSIDFCFWRSWRALCLGSLVLVLTLSSTAVGAYKLDMSVFCSPEVDSQCGDNPGKVFKQARRKSKATFNVDRVTATDSAEAQVDSFQTGFIQYSIDTLTDLVGRFSRVVSFGRDKRESLFLDGILVLRSFFSNSYYIISSSSSQCLTQNTKTWNAIRIRGRSHLSTTNPSYANDPNEGFAHTFQTGTSGLQLVNNIDLETFSIKNIGLQYDVRSGTSCSGNTESLQALGSPTKEFGTNFSVIYGNNSFVGTGDGGNPNTVFAMEQANQSDSYFSTLVGNKFSGFAFYQSGISSSTFKTLLITPTGATGKSFTLEYLSNLSDSGTASSWANLNLTQLNQPAPGLHQGTLTMGAQSGNALCMVGSVGDQEGMMCAAQLPSNPAMPVYIFATMTAKASIQMTPPSLVGAPGREVCGNIILSGSTRKATAQVELPLGTYYGPGSFSGEGGQCAGSAQNGTAEVGLSPCAVNICTLFGGLTDLAFSYNEDAQTQTRETASVSFEQPADPVITASSDTASGVYPLSVNFTASGLVGAIVSFRFDLGDGTVITSDQGYASYTFFNPGIYLVNVNGTDSYGLTSNTVSIPINVEGISGCTDSVACNWNPGATDSDGSCDYSCLGPITGCTNPVASNYNSAAANDDGSCSYSFDLTGYWYVYINGIYQGMGRITQSGGNLETFTQSPDGNSGAGPYTHTADSISGDTVHFSGPWAWNYISTAGLLTDGYSDWYREPVQGNGTNGSACTQNFDCSSNVCTNGYCDGGNLAGCTSHAWLTDQEGREHFYCFVANDMGFSQARYSAPSLSQFPLGGYLVTINSQQEYDLIVNMVSPYGRNIWLGMTDLAQEGNWQSVTGEPIYWSMWGPGEPNNATWVGDSSGEQFAGLGNWWWGTYMVNDSPASSWAFNSAVYEYDSEHSDQTPNPNCSTDYDGDGICAGVDADDTRSRVTSGPELLAVTTNSGVTELYVSGNRLDSPQYLKIYPEWVQNYINWGWWPAYYADYYSTYIYSYQFSYYDGSSTVNTPLPALSGGPGNYVVTLVDGNGTSSNTVTFYYSVPVVDSAYQDNYYGNPLYLSGSGLSNLQYLRIIPEWVQNYINWGWWPSYYADWYSTNIYNYQCSYGDTYVNCTIPQLSNGPGNYYVTFVDNSNRSSNSVLFTYSTPFIDSASTSANTLNLTGNLFGNMSYVRVRYLPDWVQNYIDWGWWPAYAADSWGYNTDYYLYNYQCSYSNTSISCPLPSVPNGNYKVTFWDGNGTSSNVVSLAIAPSIETLSLDYNGSVQGQGYRLNNVYRYRFIPDWVQNYINWGWWPSYYADWYSTYVYSYQCSYSDTSFSCAQPNMGDGYYYVTAEDYNGVSSAPVTFYYTHVVPTFYSIIANPNAQTITFDGAHLNMPYDTFSYLQIGEWWQYYNINYSECWTITDTQIICPYDPQRNYSGQTYGNFYTYQNYIGFNFSIVGCTNPSANNYTPSANQDDGSCDYAPLLVGHWKFDGDYNDYGTLGNHGSQNGVSISSAGGGSAQFNGSATYGGSYVDLGPGYTTLTSGATTVSFWYKADTVANNPLFIDFKMGGGDTFISLSPGASPGTHRVYWAPRGWGYTAGSEEYAVNGWTQVTIVYNGSGMWGWGSVSFYINGNPINMVSLDCCNGGNIPYSNQLGRDSYTAQWGDNSRAFSGKLGEVRVYRGNLTANDITNLYNESSSFYFSGFANGNCYNEGQITNTVVNGTGPCPGDNVYYINYMPTELSLAGSGPYQNLRYNNGILADGFIGGNYATAVMAQTPLAYFKLDESEGTTAYDSSGNNNHGVYQGGIGYSASSADGSNRAISLDGNSGTITLPNNLVYGRSTLTIELSFKTQSPGVLFGYQNQPVGSWPWNYVPSIYVDGNGLLHAWLYKDNINFYNVSVSSQVVTDNQWHHLVLSVAEQTQKVYLDGLLINSSDFGGPASWLDMTYSQFGMSGRIDGWPNASQNYFNGTLDDIVIYSTALSDSEVVTHYASKRDSYTGGCFSNGVDTGTVVNQTGPCEGVYYEKNEPIGYLDSQNTLVIDQTPTRAVTIETTGNVTFAEGSSLPAGSLLVLHGGAETFTVMFSKTGVNAGRIVGAGEVVFYNSSSNDGVIEGSAYFFDTSGNNLGQTATLGNVYGNAYFSGAAKNYGSVAIDSGTVAHFYDAAENRGDVNGDAAFYDESLNWLESWVFGNAVFSDLSANYGWVSGLCDFTSNADPTQVCTSP